MEKSFCFGMALGLLGGALIVVNSQRARMFVRKSQDEVMDKVTSYIDNKLDEMQKGGTSTAEKTSNAVSTDKQPKK